MRGSQRTRESLSRLSIFVRGGILEVGAFLRHHHAFPGRVIGLLFRRLDRVFHVVRWVADASRGLGKEIGRFLARGEDNFRALSVFEFGEDFGAFFGVVGNCVGNERDVPSGKKAMGCVYVPTAGNIEVCSSQPDGMRALAAAG